MKVLFICHANICRSFMAQEFLQQLLPGITVCSRGLYANPAYQVPQKVILALQQQNIPFTGHTSTALTAEDLQAADLIFCMEKAHETYLLDRYSQFTDKIWLLPEFASYTAQDLPDPIDLEGRAFAKQAKRLYQYCQAAAQRIKKDLMLKN